MLSVGVVMVGSHYEDPYVLGVGVLLCGVGDCSGFSIALSLAGRWKESGVSVFNLVQSWSIAISTMLMVLAEPPLIMGVMGCVYLVCVGCLWAYGP